MLLEDGQQMAQAASVASMAQDGNDAFQASTAGGSGECAQAVLANEAGAAPSSVADKIDAARNWVQRVFGQFQIQP